MRTLILLCVVALAVACGVAYAVGLVEVATYHPEGKYVASLTVNTAMLTHTSAADSSAAPGNDNDRALTARGKVTDVRPEQSEVVVSGEPKDWTFHLAKDGKVLINNRESKLAELQAGDDATVTFDRQGPLMLATLIRCERK